MIDAVTDGHEVTRMEEPRLYNLLENLAISRGIPMPKLKIIETDAINAFASGMNQKQYSVTVTTGLMDALDDAEVEAVLGHELTHIRNGDVRMMVIAVIMAGAISFFAELFFRMFFQGGLRWGGGSSRSSSDSDSDRKGSGGAFIAIIIAIVLVAIAWFLSIVIRFALSRSREYLADAGSVELTKNPDAMISALRKIEGRGELEGATSAVMELCVDNPREGFVDLFSTHPSIDRRIEALVRTAGGHDPGPIALEPPRHEEEEQAELEQDPSVARPLPNALGPLGQFLPLGGTVAGAATGGAAGAKPFLPGPAVSPTGAPGEPAGKPFLPGPGQSPIGPGPLGAEAGDPPPAAGPGGPTKKD
jgi:heat shock protein HtpX